MIKNEIYHMVRISKVFFALIAGFATFAFLPDTMFNWAFNYLQFIPWWGVVFCLALSMSVAALPMRFCTGRTAQFAAIATAVIFPFCLFAFRTRIHCFGGDMCVGTIPTDWAISWRNFLPPLPSVGRLDTYGSAVVTKLALRWGILQRIPGMTTMAASQLYCYVWGTVYALLAILLTHRRPGLLLVVLTLPHVCNFFGNVDSYPPVIVIALAFTATAALILAKEKLSFVNVLTLSAFWLFCGWTHPIAGTVGFLPVLAAARWFNSQSWKPKVSEKVLCAAYAIVFFSAIEIGYGKHFFSAAFNDVPPIFSVPTVYHLLNVCVLPLLPLVIFTLLGPAPRKVKTNCLLIWACQSVCFTASHFTQGSNDQFPMALFTLGCLTPWMVALWNHPLPAQSVRELIALNLLWLIPAVWVHSSELTVNRARYLYPMDICKHNCEMSWQTHLGLVLGDNLVDSEVHRKALLATFAHGARHANPAQFRGGNQLYHTAFLYHFGDFASGKAELSDILRANPQAIRYFLSPRPGFIYMNRQRLFDDLLELAPPQHRKQLSGIIGQLREQARKERYCFINPSFLKCDY